MDVILFDHSDMISYTRATAIRADARDAEIERLRAVVAEWKASYQQAADGQAAHADRAERLAESLRLIAAPIRPDGTWNRDREACRQIARDALRDHDQEYKNDE